LNTHLNSGKVDGVWHASETGPGCIEVNRFFFSARLDAFDHGVIVGGIIEHKRENLPRK
jgi:hypothetical protein